MKLDVGCLNGGNVGLVPHSLPAENWVIIAQLELGYAEVTTKEKARKLTKYPRSDILGGEEV